MAQKSPNHSNFKNSLNASLKNRKNSNTGNVFNMTGNLTRKNKRGKINLNKSGAKSKEKLYSHLDVSNYSRKKSNSRPRDKSNKHNYTNNSKVKSDLRL